MPNVCEESGIICSAQNVGILAMEIYFPYFYVDQNDLEEFDQISKGKYTTGLGQQQMGFCSDNEDINSLCLTVVSSLMEKHHIDYSQIGKCSNDGSGRKSMAFLVRLLHLCLWLPTEV